MVELFEYEFTPRAEGVLRSLPEKQLKGFYDDLSELLKNPVPDGSTKRWIDAPPATAKDKQVARARLHDLLVDYRFRAGKLLFTRIQKLPQPSP